MGKYVENNLNKNEVIVKEAKRANGLIVWNAIWGVVFSWLFLIPLIIALKNIISYLKCEFAITNKRVIGKYGVFSTHVIDAPLDKIQGVTVSQGLAGKIFKTGTVVVKTAADSYGLANVKDPEGFKAAILAQIDQAEEDRVKAQAEAMAASMAAAMNANK